MPDVIKQIFSNRAVHNGYAVVSAGKTTIATSSGIFLRPARHYTIEPSGISVRDDGRWDDKTYYST